MMFGGGGKPWREVALKLYTKVPAFRHLYKSSVFVTNPEKYKTKQAIMSK